MHQEHDLIPLKDELAYLDNYLRIVEYSGSYDFILEKDIDENTQELLVLRFILQPILENAIYHGLPQGLDKEGKILISTHIIDKKLILTVEDNGDGMTEQQIDSILKEQVQLFFGKEYGLAYESELGKYTRAVFTLPVIRSGESNGSQYALTEKTEEKKDVKD